MGGARERAYAIDGKI
nr:hypothetical protein [Tanacetum cinerariifolium]